MNDLQRAMFRDLHMNPLFGEFCQDMERHKKSLKWKPNRSEAEWAHATGFGEGIDFVLKHMGYDNGR